MQAYHVVDGLCPTKTTKRGLHNMKKSNFNDSNANQRTTQGNVITEYNFGSTKVRICNNSNSYINLTENQKKDRDYSLGATVLRLLSEIGDTGNDKR